MEPYLAFMEVSGTLGSNGELGTFSPAAVSLPAGRNSFVPIVTGNYLHLVTGDSAGGVVTTLDRAVLQ